jgi:ribosomal protein S21
MATNVAVELRRGESSERLIRRFSKKCKKERVLEIYREKTSYYIKPSVKRKIKHQKAVREKQKLQRKKDAKLFR